MLEWDKTRLSAKLLKADLFKLIKKIIDIYRLLIYKIFQCDHRHRANIDLFIN